VRLVPLVRGFLTVFLLTGLMATAPAASAHTVLTATDPAADSTVNAGPARVTATFNEQLQPTFVAMTVVGPDGNLWSQGDAKVDGATASVGLRPLGPSGRYTVNYRVTSDDGHVVSGSWSFTVTVPSTGTPGPAVEPTAQRDRIPLWPFIIGAAVLIAGAAVWGLRRRS
jgi:methionine-rich copper-binding protein CopC